MIGRKIKKKKKKILYGFVRKRDADWGWSDEDDMV